jgi:hypothetical protein
MSFLAPLFLLGGMAVVGPVLLHLIRNHTREVRAFSSLMFLEQTPLRLEKQKRLENVWLLLLRVLVILLLACGFSRPFFVKRQAASTAAGTRTAVLLDVSGSMRREGLWKQACEEAEAVFRKASAADDVAVFCFDSELREVLGFDRWRQAEPRERIELARAAVSGLKPGWGKTVLDGAWMEASDRLVRAGADGEMRMVVISDFQDGAHLDGVQGYEWPEGLHMVLKPVKSKESQNASLQWLRDDGTGDGASVRVSNSAGAGVEQFVLGWEVLGTARSAGKGVPAYVPAGQSRVVRMPEQTVQVLRLSGDQETFDNQIYRVPQEPRKMRVLIAGLPQDDGPRSLRYFLKRAFPKTPLQEVELVDPEKSGWVEGDLAVLGENAAPAGVEAAREFAKLGRIVLVPAESERTGRILAGLFGVQRVGVQEAKGEEYALLAGIDYRHPLFLPFADPRFSDFSKMHFWRHRRLDFAGVENVQVVARFDDGAPAVVQVGVGKGSVVVLGSSWSPQDGQFALSSKFVPWMNALLEASSAQVEGRRMVVCGDRVPMPSGAEAVRCPDGRMESVQAGGVFSGTTEPGVYEVQPMGYGFAVNMASEESRIQPVSEDRLRGLGLPLAAWEGLGTPGEARNERQLEAVQLEGRQKMWRWLVALALGFVGVETVVSAVVSGRKIKESMP